MSVKLILTQRKCLAWLVTVYLCRSVFNAYSILYLLFSTAVILLRQGHGVQINYLFLPFIHQGKLFLKYKIYYSSPAQPLQTLAGSSF